MFLKIVGICALIIIALLAIGALYIFMQWRKIKKFADMDLDAMEVKIEPDSNAKWTTFDKAKFYEQEILSLGFKPVDVYSTSIGIDLWIFINDDHTQAAAITNVVGEQTMEFSAVEKGTMKAIDVTDNPSVSALTPKPHKISIGRPELSPKELYEVFLQTISDKELEKMPPEEIPALIEAQFAKEMTQLVDSGGLPEQDMDNLIELYGESLTDEEREEFMQETKMDNLARRWDKCIDVFSESQDITPKIWNQYEGCMLAVSDNDDVPVFRQHIMETLDLDEDEKAFESLVGGLETSQEIITALQEKLVYHKIQKLGSVTEPFQAKIYGYEHPETEPPYL